LKRNPFIDLYIKGFLFFMEKTAYTIRHKINKHIKALNNRAFWRCYCLERKIVLILSYRFNLPPWSAVNNILVATAVFLATIPGAVRAQGVLASQIQADLEPTHPAMKSLSLAQDNQPNNALTLPQSRIRPANQTKKLIVTFYSSTPDQTDDSPFITADGTTVYDGLAAANFLAFGTKIKLPNIFGDKIFVVHDRMHSRFSKRIDIWVPTREEAIERGAKYTVVEIY
jgi:3D (Asp-Asp-Asp) domain-containing protein